MSTIFAPVDPETKLREMGIFLPPASRPIANYVKSVRTGNLVFLSGHGPTRPDGTDVKRQARKRS
jgi:enamine deaminase RidA (YjgF/YER057c/UK114 family)